MAGARHARSVGALCIGVTNNLHSILSEIVDFPIELVTGPEVISGSTRLKAGTAQKIALNTYSSSIMVRLHKVYGNLMVDLKVTNSKLKQRALKMIQSATLTSAEQARTLLEEADSEVKTAIIMHFSHVGAPEARLKLKEMNGNISQVLGISAVRDGPEVIERDRWLGPDSSRSVKSLTEKTQISSPTPDQRLATMSRIAARRAELRQELADLAAMAAAYEEAVVETHSEL
ncbi:hypothetical protein Q0M94_22595 (plasmid) [Deinococcus radiomollis]|uniref:hypothetical protein n=1 Tax=Deinococcus radiomollis TaxID=468916 RepID=UPI003891B5AF